MLNQNHFTPVFTPVFTPSAESGESESAVLNQNHFVQANVQNKADSTIQVKVVRRNDSRLVDAKRRDFGPAEPAARREDPKCASNARSVVTVPKRACTVVMELMHCC